MRKSIEYAQIPLIFHQTLVHCVHFVPRLPLSVAFRGIFSYFCINYEKALSQKP